MLEYLLGKFATFNDTEILFKQIYYQNKIVPSSKFSAVLKEHSGSIVIARLPMSETLM